MLIQIRKLVSPRSAFACIAASVALIGAEATAQVQVTSLEGSIQVGNLDVTLHTEIGENQSLETLDDGRFSVLVADRSVIQVCNQAKIRFDQIDPDEPKRLELERGDLRATVAPQPSGLPLEVHTPSAVVKLQGAIGLVVVDPDTGETTVTSLQDQVRVDASSTSETGAIVLNPGERVSVRSGKAPGKVRRLDRELHGRSGDCLGEVGLRAAAVATDRVPLGATDFTLIAAAGIPSESLPFAKRASSPSNLIAALNEADRPVEVCDPINCNPIYRTAPPVDDCPIPGEQCLPQ